MINPTMGSQCASIPGRSSKTSGLGPYACCSSMILWAPCLSFRKRKTTLLYRSGKPAKKPSLQTSSPGICGLNRRTFASRSGNQILDTQWKWMPCSNLQEMNTIVLLSVGDTHRTANRVTRGAQVRRHCHGQPFLPFVALRSEMKSASPEPQPLGRAQK